jgi:hypothetical protein
MNQLNFGHKQNIDKVFASATMMKQLIENIRGARLAQISYIALFQENVDDLLQLGCELVDLGSSDDHALRLYTVMPSKQ